MRLTDNYVAFCPTRTAAVDAYEQITTALGDHGLAANPTKSKVWQPNPEDLFLAG